jgi:hypothetical protein
MLALPSFVTDNTLEVRLQNSYQQDLKFQRFVESIIMRVSICASFQDLMCAQEYTAFRIALLHYYFGAHKVGDN